MSDYNTAQRRIYRHIQLLFEPRAIDFERKRLGVPPYSSPDVTDEIIEQIGDHYVGFHILWEFPIDPLN